jgi:hypothetical protein
MLNFQLTNREFPTQIYKNSNFHAKKLKTPFYIAAFSFQINSLIQFSGNSKFLLKINPSLHHRLKLPIKNFQPGPAKTSSTRPRRLSTNRSTIMSQPCGSFLSTYIILVCNGAEVLKTHTLTASST